MTIGTLSSAHIATLTSGLLNQSVAVRLNARVVDSSYDLVLVIGATVPHEVAGFAGGAKYFFPGVAGPELTHMTHWLGALATIEQVIGRIETPTRHMIEAAADLHPRSRHRIELGHDAGCARCHDARVVCGRHPREPSPRGADQPAGSRQVFRPAISQGRRPARFPL